MAVTAKLRYLRIAPRKVRLVTDLIRGKKTSQALVLLQFTTKKVALPITKLLKSAIANANNNFGLKEENLYISKITVDEGPKLKRWMPRSRGMATEIQKKTSHITLVLDSLSGVIKPLGRIRKRRLKKEEVEGKKEKAIPKMEKTKRKPEIRVAKPKIGKIMPRIFKRKSF